MERSHVLRHTSAHVFRGLRDREPFEEVFQMGYKMNDIIKNIIDIEFSMFNKTQNKGGKAPCQHDHETFYIMRYSQFKTWNEELLKSYFQDLQNAIIENRNIVAEKYAFMMEFTYPNEYLEIANFLPEITKETDEMISEIVKINVEWEKETDTNFPVFRSHGRPLAREQDTPYTTSFETYLRGELRSYSATTISLYHSFVLSCKESGRNLARENADFIAHAYGYSSLEAAENTLRKAEA
jgi:hypothetical protein